MVSLNGTRSRRRRDEPLPRVVVVRGLAVVAALLGILYLGGSLYNGVPTTHYGSVYVSAPVIGDLLTHDAVRIAGVRVGQIEQIGIGSDGQPRIHLQLDPGTRVPVDTSVVIGANGLLGARYVQLIPGHSGQLLPAGATIRAAAGSLTNGLPETIDTFDAATRRGFTRVIDELSGGLAGEGAPLNASVRGLAIGAPEFDAIARAVLAHDQAARRLLPALSSAIAPLAANRGYVRPGFTALAPAVMPLTTERAAVRTALDLAPAALTSAQAGLSRGTQLLDAVRNLSVAASATLPPAPPALTDLAALLDQARAPLHELLPDLRQRLPITAAGLQRLLADLRAKLIPELTATVDFARPQLQYIGQHDCDFRNFSASMRSMTGFGQPGQGPAGQAMAFRLDTPIPAGAEGIGVNATGLAGLGLYKRVGYEPPCTYLSHSYALLSSAPLGLTDRQGVHR